MINLIRVWWSDLRIGRQYRKAMLAQLDRLDAGDMRWTRPASEEKR